MPDNKAVIESFFLGWKTHSKTGNGLQIFTKSLQTDVSLASYLDVNLFPKWYWKKPDGTETLALGKRLYLEKKSDEPGKAKLLNELLSVTSPWFGGIGFSEGHSRQWKGLGQEWFFSPYLILEKTGNTLTITTYWDTDRNEEDINAITHIFELLMDTKASSKKMPLPIVLKERIDTPQQTNWMHTIQDIIKEIKEKRYEKCVLARQTTLSFSGYLDSVALFQTLSESHTNCYHTYVALQIDIAWVSFTPEILYKRNGKNILSMALAGTKPRGNTEFEDKALELELLNSEKEQHEHDYVSNFIQEKLTPYCEHLETTDIRTILKQHYVQHVLKQFKGQLKEGITDEQLVESLHPTPAVCGYPQHRAFEAIRRNEPFDRGWYAGIFGEINPTGAEWIVGIRSALIRDNHLHVYAGAGIVEASIPEHEWQEIEDKMKPFLTWALY